MSLPLPPAQALLSSHYSSAGVAPVHWKTECRFAAVSNALAVLLNYLGVSRVVSFLLSICKQKTCA